MSLSHQRSQKLNCWLIAMNMKMIFGHLLQWRCQQVLSSDTNYPFLFMHMRERSHLFLIEIAIMV